MSGFFPRNGKFLSVRGLENGIHRDVEKDVDRFVDNRCKCLIETIL